MALAPNPSKRLQNTSFVISDKADQSHSILRKIKNSNFWIKLTHWEYWPFSIVYIPVFIYWIWLIIKARSAFFFSASNPSIENGGMLGESKIKILDLIPGHWKPITIYFEPAVEKETLLEKLTAHHIGYPFILKPDIGERGSFVAKIDNDNELADYLSTINVPFLAQEYIDFPLEMGLFYYRYPSAKTGKVSSIVIKQLLTVIGDGKHKIKELILRNPRAKLQYKALEKFLGDDFNKVLPRGEEQLLMPIGNHCRGTAFLNGNHLINEKLNKVFDAICGTIDGFYFGRIDIRCLSTEGLYEGKDIKIMELNGAGSEPGHIYHPGTSIWTAYKAIFFHLNVLLEISTENHKLGVPYMSFKQGIHEIKKLRAYNKIKNASALL